MNSLRSIIRRMRKLWKLWRFMRFAQKQIKNNEGEYGKLLKAYRTKKRLSGQEVSDLWGSAVEKEYLEMGSPNVHIRTKGEDFLEGGYLPVGLFIAAWERYGFITGLVSGAIVITLLKGVWTIMVYINNHWI